MMKHAEHMEMQFKSSFAEVPFVAEGELVDLQGENEHEAENKENNNAEVAEEDLDPYTRAMKEQMNRDKAKDANNEEVSWPAGAIEENNDYNQVILVLSRDSDLTTRFVCPSMRMYVSPKSKINSK